jgi:hypothetical protein
MLPLAGVRVVDLTNAAAEPFCGSPLGAPAFAVAGPGRRARLPRSARKACLALHCPA